MIVLSWIVTFFDGYDTNVIAFAAPYLASAFKIDRAAMGYLFSAGLVWTMIGGFLFAYVGDRIGRRPAIIAATGLFGVLTLAFALSQTYTQLVVLRLVDGMALGGMLPLCWALNIEYVPRRFGATVVTVIMLGYSFGVALGGPIANLLIPIHGWQSVYVLGGACSIVATLALLLFLPESLKFLVATGAQPARIARVARGMFGHTPAAPGARFILSDEHEAGVLAAAPFRVAMLFAGVLRWVTPLFWFAYVVDSMAVFFLATWSPLVFEALGLTRTDAANFLAIGSLAGALGGLLLMRFVDQRGPGAVTAMPLLAIPLLLAVGLVELSHGEFLPLMFGVFLTVVGGHYGMHSSAGLFYPSAYRANGAGWATSVAKIGSIAGPTLGGLILSSGLPVRQVFICLALCPALMALCTFAIGRIYGGRAPAPVRTEAA
ncbi:MAG: MFS transporter [Acidisphaera sp.]|nr:MFS transporter [Acidisphaera sp.]